VIPSQPETPVGLTQGSVISSAPVTARDDPHAALLQRLGELERLAADQAFRLEEAVARHDSLREEHEALCGSIYAAGLITPSNLAAQVATKRQRQRGCDQSLDSSRLNNTRRKAAHPPPLVSSNRKTLSECRKRSPTKADKAMAPAAQPAPAPGNQNPLSVEEAHADMNSLLYPCPLSAAGLYVVGGHASGSTLAGVDRLEAESCRWEVLPDMPTPRHGCAAAAVIGILYVFGGANDCGVPLDTAERYDPLTKQWEPLPSLPTARHGSCCVANAGVLHVLGGYDGEGVLSAVERFDPACGRWEIMPSMPTHRGRCAAAAHGGLIYIVGGTDDEGHEIDALEELDPSQRSWRLLPPMPTARCGCAAAFAGGMLYVAGGRVGIEKLATVERYDPAGLFWDVILSMPTPRDGCAAAALPGAIYVFGGRGVGQTLHTVERYDLHENRWDAQPPMTKARCGLAAAPAER